MDNSTTVTKKMQASRKLEIVGDLVRLMEADGINHFNISVDTECGIMTYDAKQLYTWLKARELNPKVERRATYTNFPGKVSAEVNGIAVYTYCTEEELKELEAEHETV
jgi:hypothetical protein